MATPKRSSPAPETLARLQHLGPLLAKLRHERGLSQRELGAQVGWSKMLVSQVETGRLRIPDRLIDGYVAALGADRDALARTLLAHYEPEAYALIFGPDFPTPVSLARST